MSLRSAYATRNAAETERVARIFLRTLSSRKRGAVVVGLVGNLGAGKTAFVKGVAKELGLRARIISPTFLIVRKYPLPKKAPFQTLYHADAYRVRTKRELDTVGLFRILKDPRALLVIEWADQIMPYLPRTRNIVHFSHGLRENERIIRFKKSRALTT